MSDPETRDAILDVIKEACPLRTVLKKPCPYFGASNSCLSCSYDWLTISANVRKVAEKRRASYEQERDKAKQLAEDLDDCRSALVDAKGMLCAIGRGYAAMSRAVDMATESDFGPDEAEENDAGEGEDKGSESQEG